MAAQADFSRPIFICAWGSKDAEDRQLTGLWDVALASDGRIYVSEYNNHRIKCFDSKNGAFICKWGRYGNADGEFYSPTALAITTCNGMKESIMSAMSDVPALSVFPPGILPLCVSYVGDERIYVADTMNHRIQVLECDGKFLHKWGSRGSNDGQLDYPTGCAIGIDGTVYVSENNNHRIQAFDRDGKFIRKWGRFGSGDGELRYPFGMSINSSGLLCIIDGNNRVQCFRSDGTFVSKWGRKGYDDGSFADARNVLVTDDGMVYVSGVGNHRIQQFRKDGTFVRQWCSYGSGDEQLKHPIGMAMGMDGVMYVADYGNHRIVCLRVGVTS